MRAGALGAKERVRSLSPWSVLACTSDVPGQQQQRLCSIHQNDLNSFWKDCFPGSFPVSKETKAIRESYVATTCQNVLDCERGQCPEATAVLAGESRRAAHFVSLMNSLRDTNNRKHNTSTYLCHINQMPGPEYSHILNQFHPQDYQQHTSL